MQSLPPLITWKKIQARLSELFPPGSAKRQSCISEVAAKTIFVMVYVGAVEGRDVWVRPDQVTRMSDRQARLKLNASREKWAKDSLKASKGWTSTRWYAPNTRESIRDDSLRNALIPNGAVIERLGLPTTSPAPRYALQSEFASLLDPNLSGNRLADAIEQWQSKHLTSGTLARIAILRSGAVEGTPGVLVKFPNGETRQLAPGASSNIAKSVVEDFAPRFLGTPAILWLSESRNKVVARDNELARSIGLNIESDRNLPDLILADLAPNHPILVFVEVVATDGPIHSKRKLALAEIAEKAGFPLAHLRFVTAYLDRSEFVFKKTCDSLAWGTFAWFAAEPNHLVQYHDSRSRLLYTL